MDKQPNSRHCFVCGLQNPVGLRIAFYNDPASGQVRAEGGAAPAVVAGGNAITGFGREDVRTPERFNAAPPGEVFSINARVSSVRQRQPGIYAFTLEDGAEWIFTNSVSASYRPPQAGSVVEIRRGSIGSFLMRFDNQESVRVRRQR